MLLQPTNDVLYYAMCVRRWIYLSEGAVVCSVASLLQCLLCCRHLMYLLKFSIWSIHGKKGFSHLPKSRFYNNR